MTDRELDLAYERESDKLWEDLNKRDADWDRMLDAVGFINVALEHLDHLTDCLVEAQEEVDGLPCEYRIGSFIETFEDLACDVRALRDKFIRGEG